MTRSRAAPMAEYGHTADTQLIESQPAWTVSTSGVFAAVCFSAKPYLFVTKYM